ncbi:MAG: hypothetical protein V3R64_08880 [Sphingomonadales bacterium]
MENRLKTLTDPVLKNACERAVGQAREAYKALEDGEVDGAWKCFNYARRLEILSFEEHELEAFRLTLSKEGQSEKISKWRREAIEENLKALKNKTDIKKKKPYVFEAARILGVNGDNEHFKISLLRNNITILLSTLGALLIMFWFLLDTSSAVLYFKSLAALKEGATLTPPFKLVIMGAFVLGAIGACLTGLFSLTRMTTGGRGPERIASTLITLSRPAIGGASALAAIFFLQSKIISFGDLTLATYWAVAFSFGFSERLVIGTVEKMNKK